MNQFTNSIKGFLKLFVCDISFYHFCLLTAVVLYTSVVPPPVFGLGRLSRGRVGCKTISKLKFKRHINACSGDKTVTSSDTFIQTTKRGYAEHIISRFNCNFYVLMNLHEFSYYKTFL